MHVVRLGVGAWGQVLALAPREGECPVLDYLMGLDPSQETAVGKMMWWLRERIPAAGPPTGNKRLSNSLGDGIFELKAGQLRVPYFYDAGGIIVCTHGFTKKGRKAPPSEIERARRMRAAYFRAVERDELTIVDL